MFFECLELGKAYVSALTVISYEIHPTSMTEAIGIGSIVVGVLTRGKTNTIRITAVLHVPKLQANLLSVSKLCQKG